MPGTLAPTLLLSMPQLTDPNFNRTVILLCTHSEDQGAFGLVLNRPLVTTDQDLEVWVGGPVEPHRSWILVESISGQADDDVPVADQLSLST